jgi:NADH:ubiquinone oxidoreductase subunit F (NADH-binding)
MTSTESGTVPNPARAPEGPVRLFAAGADAGYAAHRATYGHLDFVKGDPGLRAELERSGLEGRGGAGFSTARKVEAARQSASDRMFPASVVVIANGAEGEPRSIKDSTLLRHAPHLVIDGLLATAALVGASRMYLHSSPESMGVLRSALAERRDTRRITLVEAKETFISGEASAVVNAIENGIALPTDRTVRLTTSGLRGRPTLVHNVETLAHVALIARFGGEWFRSEGVGGDAGTRLVTVSGAGQRERVLEVPGDARITDILEAAGVSTSVVSAVLVGGYHGTWIPAEELSVVLSKAALAPFGGRPGAGVLYLLARDECGLQVTASITRYLAGESAGQCGPCIFGLDALASLMERIASGRGDHGLRRQAERLGFSLVGRGSCHHPDGTAGLVQSALNAFASDVDAHLSGRCRRTARA